MPRDSNHRLRPAHLEERPFCGAIRTTSGDPCRLTAGFGTDHLGYGRCKHHGGATKSGALAGGAEMARSMMVLYGTPVDISPTEALLQEVRRSAGHVQWLGQMIQQMGEEAKGVPAGALITVLTEQGHRPAAFIDVYRKEREHLARVAKLAIDAGIAERHVRLAEQQGQLVAGVIQSILAKLDLSPEQRRLAPQIVRGELLSLGTDGVPV